MAMKEYVRAQMFTEMEPMRVQVALLQKQLQELDVKSQQLVALNPRNKSRESDQSALSEKKQQEMSPRVENWMHEQDTKITETNSRVGKVEGVLRELGALHDKFAQRHDSLVECVRDMDLRIDHVDKIATQTQNAPAVHVPAGPPGGPLASVPEDGVIDGHGSLPPGFVPPPPGGGGYAGAAQHSKSGAASSSSGSGAQVFTAREHQAQVEVEEFDFEVSRQSGVSLGVVLRNDGSKLVVDQINEGCGMPVIPGDRIVAIDGCRGDSKALLEMIRRTGKFKIICQRLLNTSL
jgi:hypothetical protein